jgi:hypothetical protein
MTKKSNIPIVTDVPPDERYTAGQVLHRVISNIPEGSFELYWLNQSALPKDVKLPRNCALVSEFEIALSGWRLRFASMAKALGRRMPTLDKLGMLFRVALALSITVAIGIQLGLKFRRGKQPYIWFVIQGEKTVVCASIASFISGKPFILHQWDPLSWWMTHKGHPKKVQLRMHSLLSWLEKRASLNVVPSDSWKAKLAFEKKNAMRLDNFFERTYALPEQLHLVSDPAALHAVFVGQFYSNRELVELIRAISASLSRQNLRLVIHYFGFGKADLGVPGCQFISHGATDRDSLVDRISKWDCALLPYPMEERFLETSTLSFPSKSRVYLAAGLPIVSWARKESSPQTFFSEHFSEHYFNAQTDSNLDEWLINLHQKSAASRRERYKQATEILVRNFSKQTELEPFRKFILG